MARPPRRHRATEHPGPGVDIRGINVVDPTKNVMDMVQAAIQRQDDLRFQESQHIREIMDLRNTLEDKIRALEGQLRQQEAERINAIRAVDVGNVSRAAEVAATQASTLASQVATVAEALRSQVAAAAQASANSQSQALEPIQTAINDLRKAQYEQQGQKYAQSEGKDTSQWTIVLIVGGFFSIVQIVLHFLPK